MTIYSIIDEVPEEIQEHMPSELHSECCNIKTVENLCSAVVGVLAHINPDLNPNNYDEKLEQYIGEYPLETNDMNAIEFLMGCTNVAEKIMLSYFCARKEGATDEK